MDKLQKVRDIASRKRIKGKIVMSTRKDKKYMILINGKRIHFGAKNYSDFLDHKDKKRRNNFHNRFRTNKSYNNKLSGLYYSRMLLW